MNLSLNLRSLEPDDINFLLRIENDESLWKYSNTTKPYSREVLQTHIENSKEDFFTAKQQRFVLNDFESNNMCKCSLFSITIHLFIYRFLKGDQVLVKGKTIVWQNISKIFETIVDFICGIWNQSWLLSNAQFPFPRFSISSKVDFYQTAS